MHYLLQGEVHITEVFMAICFNVLLDLKSV